MGGTPGIWKEKMYVASILGLALTLLSTTNGFEEKAVFCNSAALNIWTNTFLQFIGYTGFNETNAGTVWKTYYPLAYYLNNMISVSPGSMDGFYTVCNGFEQLWGGLLAQGNQNCLTAENLIAGSLAVDPTTAFANVGLLNRYKFICGAGFYTLLRENVVCVQRVLQQFNTTFQGCLATWQTNVQHDPANSCNYMGDFTACYAQVFNQSSCSSGNNIDFWWACEGTLQFALAQFPSCRHARSCTLNRNPFGGFSGFELELMEWSKTHYKFENGAHWFKLPDVFKEINGEWVLSENDWVTG